MAKKSMIEEMYTDKEYEALFQMPRGAIIEKVARDTLLCAAQRFYRANAISKGDIGYDEVADELREMSDEV